MKMKNLFITITICLTFSCYFYSQPKSHIEHYGLADGLPERTIMNIIQDKKGFMWFATWDGLCKFNGYNFITYKSSQDDSIFMRSNRIDNICEDAYGHIWVHTYGRETFRFDPKKEKYVAEFHLVNNPFSTSKVLPMRSGKVWLISEDTGAVCISDTTNKTFHFNIDNNTLKSNYIYTVHEDAEGNSWLLTKNGLVKTVSENENIVFFANNQMERNSFYCAYETENEIWFGTNEGRIWCYNKDTNRFEAFDTGIDSKIVSIKKLYENLLVILSSHDGFLICDTGRTSIKKYNKTLLKEMPTNTMVSCFVDKTNNIWLEMNCPGVARFNTINNQLTYYDLKDARKKEDKFGPNFAIVEDKSGRIWIHPEKGGLSYYDKVTDRLLPFYNDPESPNYKFSDKLHDMFVDQQGNLWLSTRSGGVEKVVFENEMFRSNDFNKNHLPLVKNEIRAIFQDKEKNIWLASKDNLILVYDYKKNFKGYLCTDGSISKSSEPINATAYTFHQDDNNYIWIGTKGHGIYILEPNSGSYKITQHKHSPSNINSLNDDRVYSIHRDRKGQIWIGTYGGGINLFDKANKQFIHYQNTLSNYPMKKGHQVRSINSYNNKIYVGTTHGLIVYSLEFNTTNQIDYKIYTKTHKTNNNLMANDIHDIYITKDNDVFIATFGGGLSRVTKFDEEGFPLEFKTYDASTGLNSDIILSVIEDNNSNIWINNEGNLMRLNPKEESFEQFNDASRILNKHFFSEALPLLSSDGEIIMGTTTGTISFFPENISKNNYNPYLALIQFRAANNYPLGAKIDDLDKITLKHNENVFSIEFAALDLTDPKAISYAYLLEGIDKEWVYNKNQQVVNYTKIPPGDYTFRVKSTNSDGSWANNERSLYITVKPVFWQTSWAYFIYIVLILLFLFVILRSLFVFYRMRDKVLLEHEQSEMRTRFFTDISHEIRTPLTMIVSPLENILEERKTYEEMKPQFYLMLKNANRMLKMVNQILDFRKIQKQKLKVKKVAIGQLIEEICENLAKEAENRGIVFNITNQAEATKIWVDTDSFEKLIFNLVSNSIKHTSKGEKIEIRIFKKDKSTVGLEVKDQGSGMTKEILNKLFTRFASFNSDKSKPSTGIGLSIVKEVVDKHHARINVESDISKGTTFTILFQIGLAHFSNDKDVEIINIEKGITLEQEESPLIEQQHTTEEQIDESLTILVVEDDSDLRNFIKSILSPHYSVIEAKNGQEGYALTIKKMPNFILSDIMMPEMTGIEFLKKIRNNQETSHIPFILLTAKTNMNDRLEGITLGADDYITKPFNVMLLKAKIDNIIEQRKQFTNYILGNNSETLPDDIDQVINSHKITSEDELFLKELQNNIIENIDNSDLSIDELVSKTIFSRRVFFNKVKSLTGLSPVQFVRETRIKQSAQLLKHKEYRIKEITYMTGFSDRKYFTQCFKKMYGVTPTEYRNQFTEDESDIQV